MCQVNISVSPNIDLSSARLMLHCQDCQSGLLFTRLISISLLSEKISNIKRGMDLLQCKHKIKVLPCRWDSSGGMNSFILSLLKSTQRPISCPITLEPVIHCSQPPSQLNKKCFINMEQCLGLWRNAIIELIEEDQWDDLWRSDINYASEKYLKHHQRL